MVGPVVSTLRSYIQLIVISHSAAGFLTEVEVENYKKIRDGCTKRPHLLPQSAARDTFHAGHESLFPSQRCTVRIAL